jgi:predicted N-acetyltransferase YhbS
MKAQSPPAIRPARRADAARIAELLTELGYPANAETVRKRLAYWLDDQASMVLVAERGGRVVGCISLHAVPYLECTGRWLRIESLVVEVTSKRSRADAHAFYGRLGFADACGTSGRFTKEL